jgi:hypothetical protein
MPRLKITRGGLSSAFGAAHVTTDWTFTRAFTRSATPNTCPASPEEAGAAQPPDCATQGPFSVPVAVSYRSRSSKTGELELYGVVANAPGQRGPDYLTCHCDALHELDILDGGGCGPWAKDVTRLTQPNFGEA